MVNKQITIAISVTHDDVGNVLFAQRKDDEIPDAHGKWEFPGGKIEFGEDPVAAVIRETKEETGLDVEVEYLLPYVYTNIWRSTEGTDYHVLILAYACTVIGGTLDKSLVPTEIQDLRFLTTDEISKLSTLTKTNEIIDLYLKTKH